MFNANTLADLKDVVNMALAHIPYPLMTSKESYYQSILYILLNAAGLMTRAEEFTNNGRPDLVVTAKHALYIMVLKMDQPASGAILQIRQKGYSEKYRNEKSRSSWWVSSLIARIAS